MFAAARSRSKKSVSVAAQTRHYELCPARVWQVATTTIVAVIGDADLAYGGLKCICPTRRRRFSVSSPCIDWYVGN